MTLHSKIVIIGSGFAGLGMGIQLKRSGRADFVILERAQDVGGTWRDNHYPGVACDVPSHLYSFSYLPKPDWSRVFSPGPEIQAYMRQCAEDEGLMPHIRFGTEMLACRWDEDSALWTIETSQGDYTCNVLITGTGHLADSHMPKIPGIESFPGDLFHSADWNHEVALEGRRIGVVGSGASAIQIIPEMQKVAGELVVFQRSAPYMIPRWDRAFSEGEKRMFRRDPSTVEAMRSEIFWAGEYNFAQRRNVPRFLNEAKAMALGNLERNVADPDLRARLTPNYEVGCKRLLISNAYYPAMCAENTRLEASALAKIEGSTVYGASGESYDLDVLVFATGFEAVRPPFAARVFGREGISLDAHWDKGMQAYDSIAVHGYPNLFIINGPNTGLGHNSVVYIIEAQVNYILEALDHLEQNQVRLFEAAAEAEDAYMDRLQGRAEGTVWLAGGCKSWYVDERSGRLTLVWPDYAHSFRDENGHFHPEGYEMVPGPLAAE
ncbi:NAD(P)/FAD-dependent oxidoreductase [Pseudooceanicola sp. CBS1P-1]|uniref:NAD(P)-binding protein n=1 Tax=Pseudooceanicola albus TaxID=2692189 RepID=A0A6L7G675_9RHOB|nr:MULTISPECIES: NAD(P)/FAD-dependent oxidoreductase [Pseudooceanicola]MBT9386028.1 NAD(P)/FAD-dependent oxidoreductase [Pseudooceanicola endophyticus]MXN19551.1 NAD(P)-binding protein [Pseudooceanicola albus]